MQKPDNIVDVATADRDSCVGNIFQLRDNFFPVIFQIECDNLVIRNHDVFNRDLFQIKNAQQHLLVFAG